MKDLILNFISQIETGNLLGAKETFEQMVTDTVDGELDETRQAVAQSMFGEAMDLAELDKTTLRAYVDKVHGKARGVDGYIPAKKLWKRTKGVDSALKKLTKEDADLGGACWKGYVKKGMKMKGGKQVPNCVEK